MSFCPYLLKLHDRGDRQKRCDQRIVFWSIPPFQMPSIFKKKRVRSRTMKLPTSYVFILLFAIFSPHLVIAKTTTKTVDVESLGLDNVDDGSREATKIKESDVIETRVVETKSSLSQVNESKVSTINQKKLAEKNPERPEEKLKNKVELKSDNVVTEPVVGGIGSKVKIMMSRVKNLLHNDEGKAKNSVEQNPKKPQIKKQVTTKSNKSKKKSKRKISAKKYLNSPKKRHLKKRIEKEGKARQEVGMQAKLDELRRKYLITYDAYLEDSDDEVVAPQKKDLNIFLSEESPPIPIMDRLRSRDNVHIPIVITQEEHIETLFGAATSGIVSFFNSAYKNVENPNVRNQIGETILTHAILLQKHAIVVSILAKGANPDMQNQLGYTPLDIAIEMMDLQSIKLLVDQNADVNYLDALGRTHLMHAARTGFLPAVELLVERGANLNVMDEDGFTALSIAYRHNKEAVIKFLLKSGAKTWVETPFDPGTQSIIKDLEGRWK